jgi:integrase
MRRKDPTRVVLVCRWKGHDDRFFGKYKGFDTQSWLHIPGGAFPPEFDTPERAMVFAEIWYADALSARKAKLATATPVADPTWGEICDAYLKDVNERMRGKASTRRETTTITNAWIRSGLLARGKPADIDENRCLAWLRSIASQNISAKPGVVRRRKPNTIRNIARQLRYLFKVALRGRLIPGLTSNPTKGDEFMDELKAILARDDQREWLLPVDSLSKLVSCATVPTDRRISYLAMALTGLRPGELAGLQCKHIVQENGITFLRIEQQWTPRRGKGSVAGFDTLKTRWSRRMIPIHRSLWQPLAQWLTSGWKAWVGRSPQREDFIFPDADGTARRDAKALAFRKHLTVAGCPTEFAGSPLKPYALRHTFSTLLTEGHAADAAHDRLMGHRAKDTKSFNYSAKLLPFLAVELNKLAFELPADAPSFGTPPSANVVADVVMGGSKGARPST